MTKEVTVGDIVHLIHTLYPPHLAQSWDSVGLICGNPDAPVHTILVGLDPVAALGKEAQQRQADFILTHHPLYLHATSSVAATTPKGRLIHHLITNNIALMNAHTNADCAHNGVAHSLARRLDLRSTRPMDPLPENPSIGLGRIGELPVEMTFEQCANYVASRIPASAPGLLAAGPRDALVKTMLVSPGAGDSFLERARELGADVYFTADLRHHPASEHVEGGKPYLLCGTHWATESVWIEDAVHALRNALSQHFPHTHILVEESTIVSEPWNFRLPTKG
ncbi:MAG: Nif3-like dinuclear metal center hexameric protein [Actinomycetaceae bacterium]|nr:Nif3-like dinuclear metal center hexameric protein [Actinomycetaceae bacterium]